MTQQNLEKVIEDLRKRLVDLQLDSEVNIEYWQLKYEELEKDNIALYLRNEEIESERWGIFQVAMAYNNYVQYDIEEYYGNLSHKPMTIKEFEDSGEEIEKYLV